MCRSASFSSLPKSLKVLAVAQAKIPANNELNKKVKRSVRFSEKVSLREIESVKDFSNETKHELFYDSKDSMAILDDCVPVLVALMTGCVPGESDSFCVRGLEDKTVTGQRERHLHIFLVTEAVMNEQMRQWEEGVYDVERLANASREYSSESQSAAQATGLKDESDASIVPMNQSERVSIGVLENTCNVFPAASRTLTACGA